MGKPLASGEISLFRLFGAVLLIGLGLGGFSRTAARPEDRTCSVKGHDVPAILAHSPDLQGTSPAMTTPGLTEYEIPSKADSPATPGKVTTSDPSPFHHPPPTNSELDKLMKSGFATQVRVDRVIVPAVVTDRKGRPVQGLTVQDFKLLEDKVPQTIDFFQVDQTESVSIAFLLDVSGSMRLLDKLGEAREAIRYFLDGLKEGDSAALLVFADDEVQTLAPFGTPPAGILARLEAVKAYGQTALHDAIGKAPSLVGSDRKGRKAIVLITDGIDNASKISLFEAMSAARKVDVPIYSIGFSASAENLRKEEDAGSNAEVLKLISMETGGNFFWIDDPDDLKEAIHTVEEDLRSQYVLGYTPPNTRCDGSFRKIDLTVRKNSYHVRTRKGYVSGPC